MKKTKLIKNFFRHYRTSSKANLILSNELQEILFGLMLGDIHAERRNTNGNTRIQFKQSIKNIAYIQHLFSLFKDYSGAEPKISSSFDSRANKNKVYSAVRFWTYSLACFNLFRELFYDSSGLKIIPENIGQLLTARGLAYWIMDDGYNSVHGFYLCTESFSFNEIEKLKAVLENKFELKCGIHKHTNGHRLYIFASSKDLLLELVKPYLIPHFYYKFKIEDAK